jgi:uncharacterized caspase-like protein
VQLVKTHSRSTAGKLRPWTFNDQNATKNNILKAIEDLADRVQPENELFVFLASHGTAAQDRFFLIPHDLGYAGSRSALDISLFTALHVSFWS